MNNTELENKVQQWFVDRNLHEANPVKQFLKLMEESGELFEGVAKDKSELIYDALGDIQVLMGRTQTVACRLLMMLLKTAKVR